MTSGTPMPAVGTGVSGPREALTTRVPAEQMTSRDGAGHNTGNPECSQDFRATRGSPDARLSDGAVAESDPIDATKQEPRS